MPDLLAETTARWGLSLDTHQLDQFAAYSLALRRWNERLNLTAIVDEREIVARHFLDSLRCAQSWGANPHNLIDIGTGAGFPGLPLKIVCPALKLTLVESIAKKASFLEHVAAELGLNDVDVVVTRAETIGHALGQRECYDVATARAVAELRVLAEYCLPLCRVGGRFLAPKGPQIAEEADRAAAAIARLGGGQPTVEAVDIPEVERRTLVIVEKIAPTPAQYPRGVGVPLKRPL